MCYMLIMFIRSLKWSKKDPHKVLSILGWFRTILPVLETVTKEVEVEYCFLFLFWVKK